MIYAPPVQSNLTQVSAAPPGRPVGRQTFILLQVMGNGLSLPHGLAMLVRNVTPAWKLFHHPGSAWKEYRQEKALRF